MAGMIGSRSARPRLSLLPLLSAISAICCTAIAGSQALRVENTAPAMAVPAKEEEDKPLGRFWRDKSEVGSFELLGLLIMFFGVLLVAMHLAFNIAIVVAIVAAIEAKLALAWVFFFFPLFFGFVSSQGLIICKMVGYEKKDKWNRDVEDGEGNEGQ